MQEGDELIRSRSGDDVIALSVVRLTMPSPNLDSEHIQKVKNLVTRMTSSLPGTLLFLSSSSMGEAIISAARIDTEGLFNLEGKERTGTPSSSQYIDITPDQLKFVSERKSSNLIVTLGAIWIRYL